MIKRNTETKNEVLLLLKNSDSALSHDTILEKIKSKIDRSTVYRILNSFCDDKIVHKIMGDNGKQYFKFCSKCFESNHKHNHFHFRCKICGNMECLEGEIEISLPHNYVFNDLNAVVVGYCANCR